MPEPPSRDAALALLAACSPERPAEPPLSPSFACWTPLTDWARGPADGLAALRRAAAAALAAAAAHAKLAPSAVVACPETVVIEVELPGRDELRGRDERSRRGGSVSMTLSVSMRGGLVEEARCYLDPEAVAAPPDLFGSVS